MSQIPKASVYTKKGDLGSTSLVDGQSVSKYHPRVQAYGDVDELNSFIGSLRDSLNSQMDAVDVTVLQKSLFRIQNHLFNIGSRLACENEQIIAKLPSLDDSHIEWLEKEIDFLNHPLPKLSSFILPGGHPSSSWAHLCRTVCRRAERHVVGLGEKNSQELVYLNRLSDYFFTLARWIHLQTKAPEVIWDAKA